MATSAPSTRSPHADDATAQILADRALRKRAMIPAMIITVTLLAAVLLVIFWAPDASATPTHVYMESENGRLVVTASKVEIGKTTTEGSAGTTTEQVTWTRLNAAPGPLDTRDGPVLLAEGGASGDGYTDVRITFQEVKIARDGRLDVLALPQDTLQVRLSDPGAAGDSLLVAIDAESSITEEDGFLSFRPRVVETVWAPGGAQKNEVPAREPAGESGPGDPPKKPAPTTIVTDSRNKGTSNPPPEVGRLHIAFIGNGTGLVESLEVTLGKIGHTHADQPDETVTFHESPAQGELVRDDGVSEMASMQVKPGTYTSLQFEFTNASATIQAHPERELVIPQPRLVLEAPFNVSAGQTVAFVVEFGVEESLRAGGAGLEFRPVIRDYHVADSEGRDIKDPYPAQYRTGGSWLPALGESAGENEATQGAGDIPHPVYGDKDRDPRGDGSLDELGPEELEDLLETDPGDITGEIETPS